MWHFGNFVVNFTNKRHSTKTKEMISKKKQLLRILNQGKARICYKKKRILPLSVTSP